MIDKLKAAMNRRITSFQAGEIQRLASDTAWASVVSHRPHYSRIGDWLSPQPGQRVLEIGCGPGRYVAMLASMGFDVVGVDLHRFASWDIIDQYRKTTLMEGVKAESLPFEDASFDAVACMGALLYFVDASAAMQEIHRVLKPGGRLILRTVNAGNLYRSFTGRNLDPATVNVYTEAELARLLSSNGFDVRETFAYGFYSPWFPAFYWYLCNGPMSAELQERLSEWCPRARRTNVNAFAVRT